MHVEIARRNGIRARHSTKSLEEMAGTALPPVIAWFAFIASCGLKVPDKKALAAKIREGGQLGRELAVTVLTAEGQPVYRLVAYDGHFRMRSPHDDAEVKQIRLGNLKRLYRRVKHKFKKL